MAIQYGGKKRLCDHVAIAAGKTDDKIVRNYVSILNMLYGSQFVGGCFYDSNCFGSAELTAAAAEWPMERQWRFQKCNEMAFLQGAPATGSIRSRYLTMDVLYQQCLN